VDIDIAAMVGAGGTALVELMLTDAWAEAKYIAARIFRRRDEDNDEAILGDLEESRQSVASAAQSENSADLRSELEAEWRSRMRRAVGQSPANVAALKELIDLYGKSTQSQSVSFNATARDNSRVYQQGIGTQNNY
jgi:hypothetical protein